MLDKLFIKKILKNGKPEPKTKWFGEPNLGSFYDKKEINAVIKVLKESQHWSVGFGPNPKEVKIFENNFAKYCGTKHAIAVSNNGDGFDMVLNTLNLKPNDEIIAPALNFKAWHMVLLRYKCKCIFVDIDPKTLNIDVNDFCCVGGLDLSGDNLADFGRFTCQYFDYFYLWIDLLDG